MLSITKMLQATKSILAPRMVASCQIHTANPLAAASVEEKLGLPPPPKKPLTGFFRFLADNRPHLAKENPTLKPVELIQLCAKKYATVDPTIKSKYHDQFLKDQSDYHLRLAEYKKKLTLEQKHEIASAKQGAEDKKMKRLYKSKLQQSGKPKKPLNGFLRFLTTTLAKNPRSPDQKHSEYVAAMAEKWRNLPDEEKKAFTEPAVKELANYKQKIEDWKLKMVRLGKTELVRDKNMTVDETAKPRVREGKPKFRSVSSRFEDWELGWYSSSQSSSETAANEVIAKPIDSHNPSLSPSPSTATIRSQEKSLVNDDSIIPATAVKTSVESSTEKKEIMRDLESLSPPPPKHEIEKKNTTGTSKLPDNHNQPVSRHQERNDEKSKKVFDTLKNLFKF